MAIFGQNRLFFSVEFRQRFIGQPGFPVQLVAGEANRGRFAALRVRGGMPVSGDQRRICADDGLMVERPQAQQQAAVDEKAAGFDIIITTAKVPGRKPPVLLTAAGVKGLKRGAVIVDCAASDLGGNVEGSAVGEQVTEGGVKLIGAPYLASGVATTASNLLSRNVADILVHFVRDGKLGQDLTEELDDALVVAGRAAAPAAAADAEKSEK